MPIVRVTKRLRFNAAHRVHNPALSPEENTALFGPCNNPNWHGHNYVLEVVLEGELDARGFVLDYGDLRPVRDYVAAALDHRHLNDVLGHDRTTAEVIAKWLYDWCRARWPEVVCVRVSETPKTWAEYRP